MSEASAPPAGVPKTHLSFVLNGVVQRLTDVAPTMTLLEHLREARRLTGAKEGCAEGDCGSCTVVVGARAPGGGVTWRPANACILLLGMLEGKAVVTVEGVVGRRAKDPHPAQAAMVETHGTQCGFCTPGIVMSLYALRLSAEAAPSRGAIGDALAGNLCRCTGYGPIYAAAEKMFEAPCPAADHAARAADAAQLEQLATPVALALSSAQGVFHAPTTLARALELYAAHPETTVVAGATDVGLWITKDLREIDKILHLGRIEALNEIKETVRGGLWIGAGATYADAEDAIAARWPDFAELFRRLGSTQVRATGTIGGNIANGSPIGDTPPALIALGADVVLRHGIAERRAPMEEFFLDYGVQDRRPGELVVGVDIPPGGASLRCYKLSKRFDQDISAVCGCFNVTVDAGRVVAARIAFGGMATIPKRAYALETALLDRQWTDATVERASAALARDFTPISDMRASAAYRLRAAQNMLRKYYVEMTAPATRTRLVGRGAAVVTEGADAG